MNYYSSILLFISCLNFNYIFKLTKMINILHTNRGDTMNTHLFSIDIRLGFILAFIFLFIFPLFIKNKKPLALTYFFIYISFLLIGVFSGISIHHNQISFNLLITNKWFNNEWIVASFGKLNIIINIFLCFPLGVILPTLLKKPSFLKIIFIGILFTFCIEFLQFTLPIYRNPELFDLLTNTLSVILGFYYYLIIKKTQRF